MSSVIQANVTIQGSITTLGTFGQTTYAPVDLGASALSLASGNLTSLITTSSSAPTAFTANNAGEGSLVFPGTANAYISFGTTGQPFSNSNIYAFGDFVVEAWVNPTSISNGPTIIGYGDPSSAGQNYWNLSILSSGVLSWYSYMNSVGSNLTTSGTIPLNTWTHITLIHQSSSKRVQIYINGQPQTLTVAAGSFSVTGTVGSYTTGIIPVLSQFEIGQQYTSTYVYNGRLTNLRITTGSGAAQIYNNNAFTPSTSPLFPASNTSGGSLTTRLLVRVPLATTKMVVPKLGGTNTNSVLAFPPAPMTGYSTNMTGQSYYGQGTYVASASSEVNSSYLAWYAFNKTPANSWSSAGNLYNSSTGIYTGSVTTVDMNGAAYAGEWVQVQLPVSLTLSSYVVQMRGDAGNATGEPKTWWILGSRDGTSWFLVDQRSNITWNGASSTNTLTANASTAFSFFRCVTNVIGAAVGAQNVAIGEWTLNGTIEGPSISPDGRLGVGVSNPVQALEVAGSALVGGTLSAGNPLTFKNRIINGDMRIAQRGTTFSLSGSGSATYTLDRWTQYTASGSTRTVSNVLDVPFRSGFVSSANVVATAATTTTEFWVNQNIEIYNILDLLGSPVTLSFWYKSNRVGNHGVRFNSGGNIPGNTDTYQVFTVVNANTWEYKVLTFNTLIQCTPPGPSTWNGAGMSVNIGAVVFNMGSTSIANGDYFTLTGVQLEKGTVATPFEFRPFGVELQLCQRYYEKSYSMGVAVGTNSTPGAFNFYGGSDGSSNMLGTVKYCVPKRTSITPSFWTQTGTANQWTYYRNGASGNSGVTVGNQNEFSFQLYAGVGAAYTVAQINGHWEANAEL